MQVHNLFSGVPKGRCQHMGCGCMGFLNYISNPGVCVQCGHYPIEYAAHAHSMLGWEMVRLSQGVPD